MNIWTPLAALAAAAVLAAAGCGDDGNSSSSGNSSDRGFAAAMVPHHEGAVEMAKIAQKRGESAFVKGLADDIIRTQTEEIATLRREDEALDTAGIEKGTIHGSEHEASTEDDPGTLREAQPFDTAFLEMMIPHHVDAIEMAKDELADGKDPELRELARDIIAAQEREIDRMREHLGMEGGPTEEGEHR